MPTNQILADVLGLLNASARDWEFDGEITADTWLVADLGFESLDLVVLGTTLQEHYKQTFPFPELFTAIGQSGRRDLSVGELVRFVHDHLPMRTVAAGDEG